MSLCPVCPAGQYNTFFGPGVTHEMNLAMDTSLFARGALGTWDLFQGKPDPLTFPALGLTTILSFFSGLDLLHLSWHRYQKSQEWLGTVHASLWGARGATLMAAGLTYIPLRVIGIWANVTTSKTYDVGLGILNQAGNGLFSVVGGLTIISDILLLSEQIVFRLELGEKGLELVKNMTNSEKSRVLGPSYYMIEDNIGLMFAENQKRIFWTTVMGLVTIFATASSLIPLVSADAGALLISSALNASTALIFLMKDIFRIYGDMSFLKWNGSYDTELFALIGAVCTLALGTAAYLGDSLMSHAMTATLGILWLAAAYIGMYY